ncbi:SUI1 family translation initiation factor [Novipirellula artificiosorum]|uniref:Translation initiation factor Sui1 n=1 Tax=Novipirellula artificiosorum TaxID=2528016 RepID=A0A5C6DJ68_9BACT|nr:translation initiation factor [Novipirellula artificiosorum]TWU34966.1 translation initiation factor Sui1 [Novipirellula artificiosorum]
MSRLFAGTPFDIPPTCDRCGLPEQDCHCPPPEKQYLAPAKQTAKVFTEHRKHKRAMTIVKGLDPEESDLRALLTKLQSGCGAGGSIQQDRIEIQGDHLTRVKAKLAELGYRVR